MNTRVFLTFATMLLLAAAAPSGAGDPAQTASAQPAASACNTMKCRRDCEKAGGTFDECREQCRVTSSGEKKRIDPMCVQRCQMDGYDRETCNARCSYSEPVKPSQPDFPAPKQPRPGN